MRPSYKGLLEISERELNRLRSIMANVPSIFLNDLPDGICTLSKEHWNITEQDGSWVIERKKHEPAFA
jgi:hypothetical protein